ncbi:MAG TPA: PAS domain-containing sensor histidine kinase [Ignavibacteriales bacterium]|nr:PAS domain-containing sensor histidine kinase [Ignavibacteriales bacterium]
MVTKSGKAVPWRHIILISLALVLYWSIFITLDKYLDAFPFPLIVAPVVAFSWFWGAKRGLLVGTFLMLSGIIVVVLFHQSEVNPVRGIFAVIMSFVLGAGAGWIRKLYDTEKKHSQRLAEEQEALLREMEIRMKAEKRALRNEHFLKTMSNTSFRGILAVDGDNDEILFSNPRFFEIWDLWDYQEKINRSQLSTAGLLDLCLSKVKEPSCYIELFRTLMDVTTRKPISADVEFKNGSVIRHFTSQIRDENDEYLGQLFIYEDITDAKRSEELLKKRNEYDRLIFKISNCFVNTADENIDEAFISSLKAAGEFLGMDMGFFYQADETLQTARNLYEWRSSRVSHELKRLSNIDSEHLPSFWKILRTFDKIAVPDIEKLPENYKTEKVFFLNRNTKAVIAIPVIIEHKFAGFLGFSSISAVEFPEDTLAALKIIGYIFAGAFIRKQKHEDLLASEERFRLLVQHSTDIIGILDENGYVKYVSPAFKTITGNEPGERIGKLIFECINPQDALKMKDAVRSIRENPGQTPLKLSLRLPLQSGRIVFLETVLNGQLNNPAINGIVCNSRDMTQHFALQEALRSSHNFLDAVINSSRDPLFVKDSSHRYTLVNEAFGRLVGFSRDQMLGKTDFDLHPKEFAERTHGKDEYVLSNGEIENFEVEFFDRQGVKHFIVGNEICYQDVKGEKFIIANIRDEARRKKMEEEINNALLKEKELSEMKSKFISMVSHEYRTPLTAILSSADLLDLFGQDMGNDERREFLQTIKNAVKYLTDLVNDVLMLNRTESGRLSYLPSLFDLVQVCRELVADFKASEGERVVLRSNLPSKTVGMDRKLLTYILMNLLSNAAKYSAAGSPVELNLTFEEEHVSFEISDKGIGIPEESFPHLFEPFYRAENAANISGSGLGLSIVKSCVDLHKGTISFRSTEGRGTTFLVKLPDDRNLILHEQ